MKKETNISFACTLCDSDIPADPDVKVGDIVYCSYCKVGLRVVQKKDDTLGLDPQDEE